MSKFYSLLLCLSLLIMSTPTSAHVDKIITMKNGELIGLPEKYNPAFLDLKRMSLRIADHLINFPPCLLVYFPENNEYDINLKSSWYHDMSLLPPYLSLSIHPNGKEYFYKIIFNMKTLIPISIEIYIKKSINVILTHRIIIDKYCMKDIRKSIIKIKQ